MRREFVSGGLFFAGCILLGLAFPCLTGCSTVTPYSADIAAESSRYGKSNATEAANLINSKISVAGDYADSGSFVLDEKGFSFKKTTESTRTETKNGKPVEMHYTEWITRDVPWSAVIRQTSYFRDYQFLFTDEYRVVLTYETTDVSDNRRVTSDEDIELSCRSYADLVDVLAAIKTLVAIPKL